MIAYTESGSASVSDLMRTEIGDAEVVTVEFKPFPQVELVGGEALYTGIQVQLLATLFSGVVFEPVHNKFAGACGSHGCTGDEVVDINMFLPGQFGADDKSCHAQYFTVFFYVGYLVAF